MRFGRLLQGLKHPRTTHRAYSSTVPGLYSVILPQEPFIWGVSHIKSRTVPPNILRPPYVRRNAPVLDDFHGDPYTGDGRITLGSPEEVSLRRSASLAKDVLEFAGNQVEVGVTTDAIDAAVHEYIVSRNAYPSPLLYAGFPKSCCTSVNNVITHGIPDERPLEDGDIVNVDITVYLEGYHGDTSRTFLVGDVDESGRMLVEVTNEALELAIGVCAPGRPFKDIGNLIHKYLYREADGDFCVSTQFTGHGIGTVFHRPPWIMHHLNDEPGVMLPGHCFTIEPCIIEGKDPSGWIFPDGWTASTENCARSAQAEHMVLITETGCDVLTR